MVMPLFGLMALVYASTGTELASFRMLSLPHYSSDTLGPAWQSPNLLSCVRTCLATYNTCYSITYNTNHAVCTPGSKITYSPDNGREPGEVFYFTNFCDSHLGFQMYLFESLVQCLVVSSTPTSFNSSRKACTEKGSKLFTPRSQEKLGLLRHIVGSITRGSTWIGLTDMDTEGVYVWEDGQVANQSLFPLPWRPGNPDNARDREDCVEMGSFGDWLNINDQYCGDTAYFICELYI